MLAARRTLTQSSTLLLQALPACVCIDSDNFPDRPVAEPSSDHRALKQRHCQVELGTPGIYGINLDHSRGAQDSVS